MRRLINRLMTGKNQFVIGLIAFGIVSVIAMGCNSVKNSEMSNSSKNDETNRTVSNTNNTPVNASENSNLPDAPNSNIALVNNTNNTSVNKSEESKGSDKPDDDLTVPSEGEMQALVKTSLFDFNDAVQKGDFTDFHSKTSTVWKKQTSPQALNSAFKEFIDKKVDISNIKDMNAEFNPPPTVTRISGYKMLTVSGRYSTSPLPVRFKNKYIKEDGAWKLFGINVDTTP